MIASKNHCLGVAALALAAIVGCGPKAAKLDKQTATTALNTFLEAWKKGETPQDLKAKSPPIIAGDDDFVAARKLVDFKVIDAEKNDGSNLHALVELTLAEGTATRKRQVTYIVGTSPVITIFPKL